jgi:DNA-binding transcriptional LysR family regulator
VKLFDRDQRRATLTAKGFELLGYAERMLQLRADMMQAVTEKMALRGLIRLGVPETIVHTWLSRLIERLHAVYPSITLEIEVDTTPNLRAGLIAHQLDVAFLLGPVNAEKKLRLVHAERGLPDLSFVAAHPVKPDSYIAAAVAELGKEIATAKLSPSRDGSR